MPIFNESTTLTILNEKKTREEYARRSFAKKYNFEPDTPGSSKGTITSDGKKYKVDTRPGKMNVGFGVAIDTPTSAIIMGDEAKDSKINLDKNFFKLKGSNKNERRDAILQHEIGHQRLHNTNADNKTVDKKNRSMQVYKNVIKGAAKDSGIDVASDRALSLYGPAHSIRKDIYDQNGAASKYFKSTGSKDERKQRNDDLEKAKRFEKNSPHANASEFEADRYAANRTSERAIKKGIDNTYKLNRKNYDKTYNDMTLGYGDEDSKKQYKKQSNITADVDMRQRSKALKDKDLRNAKTYK